MTHEQSTAIRLGDRGRLVIPAAIRRQLGVERGDVLVASVEGARLVLEPRAAALGRLRERLTAIPAGVSLVDELIAERRVEARRERGR